MQHFFVNFGIFEVCCKLPRTELYIFKYQINQFDNMKICFVRKLVASIKIDVSHRLKWLNMQPLCSLIDPIRS